MARCLRVARALTLFTLPFLWPSVSAADKRATLVASDSSLVLADSTLVDAHPQDFDPNEGLFISTHDGEMQLRISGSIRVNGVMDLNGLQRADTFDTFSIPVGDANTTDLRVSLSASQTRYGFELTRSTRAGEAFLRLESDFRGGGNRPRLRHAYGTIAGALVGQTWSTFGDIASLPRTVDFDGPNSSVAVRTVQLRYTRNLWGRYRIAVAAESPQPEIARDDSLAAALSETFQANLDGAARLRVSSPAGHVQIAGILRTIDVRTLAQERDTVTGFGVLLSGEYKAGARNRILFQLVGGEGISRFITALQGRGLDVIFDPESGFEALASRGGYVAFSHAWNPRLSSTLIAGVVDVKNKDFQPDGAFNLSQSLSANLMWDVASGTDLGVEYSWGRRRNKNGEDGTANRVSFITYFDF